MAPRTIYCMLTLKIRELYDRGQDSGSGPRLDSKDQTIDTLKPGPSELMDGTCGVPEYSTAPRHRQPRTTHAITVNLLKADVNTVGFEDGPICSPYLHSTLLTVPMKLGWAHA